MTSSTSPTAAVGDSKPTVTEAAAAGSSPSGTAPTMSTTIGSLAELRTKAPKLYQAMLFGIASDICNQSARFQDRINQMIRESEET